MSKKKQKKQYKRGAGVGIYVVLIVIFLLFGIALGYAAVQSMLLSQEALRHVEEAQPMPSPSPAPSATPVPSPSQEVAQALEEPGRSIDFAALRDQNPGVVAWLEVPGTAIDYPVLYDGTKRGTHYYLNHDIDGEQSAAGSIYLAPENKPDLSERHMVIYGHNMADGTMFAGLHQFEDKDFFNKNNTILLYTPEETLEYKILAAYEADDKNLFYEADFEDDEYYGEFLESVRAGATRGVGEDAELEPDDTVLTLSTCVEGQKQKRYLVQAVLVQE